MGMKSSAYLFCRLYYLTNMTDLDKSKLNVIFQHINKIEMPKMESDQAKAMAQKISEGLEIIKNWIKDEAVRLKNEK